MERLKKREKWEILLEILEDLERGTIKPTNLMYKTNLSWMPLLNRLETLAKNGLVSIEYLPWGQKTRKIYTLTHEGRQHLERLKNFKRLNQKYSS